MLKSISLQNFRNYKKRTFEFDNPTVTIVGPNTSGKSNLIEGIYLLSNGKSFRADKDVQMVAYGGEMGRVWARLQTPERSDGGQGKSTDLKLEVVVTIGEVAGIKTQHKRYFINGVAKRRADYVGTMPSVLFSPQDLDVIVGSPGLRRSLLDHVLEQTDRDYRIALLGYKRALKQRNALLDLVKKTGESRDKQFEYWDSLVIRNGNVLTEKREEYIDYLNSSKKDTLDVKVVYDKSEITAERLDKYKDAERAVGVTLVGPHRDDLIIHFEKFRDLKLFGSRGQQRLGILQIKFLELEYIRSRVDNEPILLLDDIFSELDEAHINLILENIGESQTIITTTHEEFIPAKIKSKMEVIELNAHSASSG